MGNKSGKDRSSSDAPAPKSDDHTNSTSSEVSAAPSSAQRVVSPRPRVDVESAVSSSPKESALRKSTPGSATSDLTTSANKRPHSSTPPLPSSSGDSPVSSPAKLHGLKNVSRNEDFDA